MIKVLSFRVAGKLFGIEITEVKEINRNVEFTTVPRAVAQIVGLFNMRGQIVTLFELATILSLSDARRRSGRVTCIILKQGSGSPNQCGFIIDEPGDVLDLDSSIVEDPPSQLLTDQSDHIAKVARLPDELLLIINPKTVFAHSFQP